MNFKRTLRKIVHDVYYSVTGKRGTEYALRCREVVGHIDGVGSANAEPSGMRLKLHLFLCQACRDYHQISKRLGQALRDSATHKASEIDLKKLNKTLVQKYEPLENRLKEKMVGRDPPPN